MSPSKKKEAAAVARKQKIILKVVEAAGSMTMNQLIAHFLPTTPGITRGAVGFMIRRGMLESTSTGQRTKNGNTINAYSVSNGKASPKEVPEIAPFLLGEVWESYPRIMPIVGVTR